MLCHAASFSAEVPVIIPAPKGLLWKDFRVELGNDWKILITNRNEISEIAEYLKNELSDKSGFFVVTQKAPLAGFEKSIMLFLSTEKVLPDAVRDKGFSLPAKLGKEGYVLEVFNDRILIVAEDSAGLFYGVGTLLQMVKPEDGKIFTSAAKITDFPSMSLRGVHMLDPDLDKVEGYLKYMADLKMNFVMISSWKIFDLDNRENAQKLQEIFEYARRLFINPVPELGTFGAGGPVISVEPYAAEGILVEDELYRFRGDEAEPVLASKSKLANLIRTEESNVIITDTNKSKIYKEGVDYKIIDSMPAYPFTSFNKPAKIVRISSGSINDKQQVLISYDYIENKCAKWAPWSVPYCPSSELTYKVMFKSLENVIAVLQPQYIGIGHDEIRGMNRDSRCKKRNMTNAELLAEDINKLNDFVKSVDPKIKLMMWDDMLNPWHNGGDENYQVQFGGPPGKTSEAIGLIPKDIIMLLWWYDADDWLSKMKNSPAFLESNEFNYIGAAYKDKKNIENWAEVIRNSRNCKGLITTTWEGWDKNMEGIKNTAEKGW